MAGLSSRSYRNYNTFFEIGIHKNVSFQLGLINSLKFELFPKFLGNNYTLLRSHHSNQCINDNLCHGDRHTHDHHHHEEMCCKQQHTNENNLENNNLSKEENFNNGTPIGWIDPQVAIIYTCKLCSKRSMQQFSKNSYKNGTVVIRCPGCQALHLIADNLGIFTDEKSNIFDYLKEKGVEADPKIHTLESMQDILKTFGIETGKNINPDNS